MLKHALAKLCSLMNELIRAYHKNKPDKPAKPAKFFGYFPDVAVVASLHF